MTKKDVFDFEYFRNRRLPTEEEIMGGWNYFHGDPVVSILCNTYNHENYIEDAIRGFVLQKTEFPFEIIVHDDASTNDNVKKIKKYAERYPNIVKLVVQSENQFSQGQKPTILSFSYASGEFVALCEGDDFWISDDKIQSQCGFLRDNPGFNGCAHSALQLSPSGNVRRINRYKKNCLSCNFVIEQGGGVVPTASLFVRRSVIERFSENFQNAPLGDYFIQVLAAEGLGLSYINSAQSVYRYASETSVSRAERKKSTEEIRDFVQRFESSLETLSEILPIEHKESVFKYQCSMYLETAIRALLFSDDEELFSELLTLSAQRVSGVTHRGILLFSRLPIVVRLSYNVKRMLLKTLSKIFSVLVNVLLRGVAERSKTNQN